MRLEIKEKDRLDLIHGRISNYMFAQKFSLDMPKVCKLKYYWKVQRGMQIHHPIVYKRNGLKPSTQYNAYIAPIGR